MYQNTINICYLVTILIFLPQTSRILLKIYPCSALILLVWSSGVCNTVKLVFFACPLFREFRDPDEFAKIMGREYTF